MISVNYRRWIASLGCCIENCGHSFKRCDPCHTGPHAYGRKSSDLNCIPLCRAHHKQFDSNPPAFVEKHSLDLPAMIENYNSLGLAGVRLHRPARKVVTPQFVRTRCVCGWQSGWFRVLGDAQGSLHAHLDDAQREAA